MTTRSRNTGLLHPDVPVCPLPGGRLLIGTDPRSAVLVGGQQARAVRLAVNALPDGHLAPEPGDAAVGGRYVALIEQGIRLLQQAGALVGVATAASRDRSPSQGLPTDTLGSDVLVVGTGSLPHTLRVGLGRLGFRVSPRSRPLRNQRQPVVLVGASPWPLVDRLMAAGVAHLSVSARPDSARVGPVVRPGRTPCLRCLHLARTDRNPDWPWIAERLANRAGRTPEPLLAEMVTTTVACLMRRPCSGGYLVVRADDPTPTRRQVVRHDACGCWWPKLG